MSHIKSVISTVAALAIVISCFAQSPAKTQHQYGLNPASRLTSRVKQTPPDVLKMFHEAEMNPVEHALTTDEQKIVSDAFTHLPPLHQQVLRRHLAGISFLDNMPNTALTSIIDPDNKYRLYHITFRAAILHQTVTNWLTEKENTCYIKNDSTFKVKVTAGLRAAFVYVLLHEGTHVVDGSLNLFGDQENTAGRSAAPMKSFKKNVWKDRTTLATNITDTLFTKNHFRRGAPVDISNAPQLYKYLQQTPFVSLYSTSSQSEDLAELLTVYHFTKRFKQPLVISVYKNDKHVINYQPMQSAQVQRRAKLLQLFYNPPKSIVI